MANPIYKLFNRGIKWNAFEGITYQSILTFHQIFLFSVASCLLYGLIGVLFSLLYLIILLCNLGLDQSLTTFFVAITKNKKSFKKIFINQLLIQLLILSCIFILLILFNKQISSLFSNQFKCPYLEFKFLIIFGLLLITESTKKSLRFICELAFLNKFIAIAEICLIIFYVATFWILFFTGSKLTLYLIFIPHLIQSLVGIIFFSWLTLSKIYNKLPNTQFDSPPRLNEILFNRFSVYINQLSHLFFSGNFLIPFLSAIYGLERISIFKLVNIIAIYFKVVLERTFGFTSGALLSNLKNASTNVKERALNLATNKLLLVLYAIIIFSIFNFKNILYSSLEVNTTNWIAIYLFLLSIIFENFFITLEQFFIAEGKIYYLVSVNLLAVFLFYLSAKIVISSLSLLISLLILIRILSFIVLKELLRRKLNINLNYKIKMIYILYFILISLFFYLIRS